MPEDKPKAIICDLDGTLALMGDRGPFEMEKCEHDTLNRPVYLMLEACRLAGYRIILVSGRFERVREMTVEWLMRHRVEWAALHLRADGDYRKDAIVKQEVYERDIKPHYDVVLSLDDRNQSVECWRSLGIPCFQVAPGDF